MFSNFLLHLGKIKRSPQDIGLYIFVLIVLAISWSGVKTIQTNYELQKQISTLKQQNAVINLQNQNTALENQYYKTNQYLDLAARQDLGLAGQGEQVWLISNATAMKYVDKSLTATQNQTTKKTQPTYIKNLDAWKDFLLGRNVPGN